MSIAAILDNIAMSRSAMVRGFASLLRPKTDAELDALADRARELTLQHFGRTMRLFAPLYLSNECINSCRYCGFSRENPILRVTLSVGEVVKEARHLAAAGFRQLLLVAGEHPKFVSRDYLAECVRALRDDFSSISIEVAPMETEEYIPIVEAGAEGLVVYQETYDRAIYDQLHLAGPKKDFAWRLACPERGYEAGLCRRTFRRASRSLPLANSRLVIRVRRRKSRRSCVATGWNRFGKIGTPRCWSDDNHLKWRITFR